MRDWKQWIDQVGRELYNTPGAYKELLPQLDDIEQYGREYRSHYKLNGEKRNRPDKTVILERMPLVVIEHGEPAHNIIRFIIDTQHKDFMTVAKRMAELTGMELPQGTFDSEKWLERQRQKELIATVQEYYHYCLQYAPEPIKTYLHSRFTDEEIEKMHLGWIAGQEQLVEYLTKHGYTQKQVEQFMESMPWYAGKYHQITIPIYRAGNIYSFIYRHHNQDDIPANVDKYQYHKGTMKLPEGHPYAVKLAEKLAYIPSRLPRENKELVIVEGQLDCLHLLADGIENVVAAGTNRINTEAVEDAIKRGYRSFTILFDSDPVEEKDPDKNYNERVGAYHKIVEVAEKMGKADEVQVFIAELPQPNPTEKVDPDSYIRTYGAAAVQELIAGVPYAWEYEYNHVTTPIKDKALTAKELEGYRAAVFDISDYIHDHFNREHYETRIAKEVTINNADGTATPIGPRAVKQMLAEHQQKKQTAKAQKGAAELMEQASRLMRSGDTINALKLQGKAAAMLAGAEAEQEYEKLMHRTTRAEIVEGLQQTPADLSTGLYLGKQEADSEIILPAGALSILAAPTSHGKTTMLVAMAVNAARNNPDKEYYLLSYEEAQIPITIKALSSYVGLELATGNRHTLQTYLKSGDWSYVAAEHRDKYTTYKKRETEFFNMLEAGRLHIHYTDMVCENLCTSIRKLADTGRLGGVFIDYIQYIDLAPSQRNLPRYEEIGKICKMLKEAAVDTGIPIILAAQFNREVTDPTTLTENSLGEGGEIERKAAYILGFWNNDMQYKKGRNYTPNAEEISKLTKGNIYDPEQKRKNKSIFANVLKNRSGIGVKAGTTGLLSFDGNIGTIGNYTDSTPRTDSKPNNYNRERI